MRSSARWSQSLSVEAYWLGKVWTWADIPALGDLVVFGCPANSGGALLSGVLPLRYCATRFAFRVPTWRLPIWSHVAGLVTEGGEDVGLVYVASFVAFLCTCWSFGCGGLFLCEKYL